MKKLTHTDLAHFTGDLTRYRHSLNRNVLYTPGIQFLAERGGAYWLLDHIALTLATSEFKAAVMSDPRIGSLHFWTLTVATDHTAMLTATADSGVEPFESSRIDVTDFPLARVDIWAGFDGTYWTLYLPSEH